MTSVRKTWFTELETKIAHLLGEQAVDVVLGDCDSRQLRQAHRHARRLTWGKFPSIALGALFLSSEQRRSYFAMAAFLRRADVLSEAQGSQARQDWAAFCASVLAKVSPREDSTLLAFADARICHQIPLAWVRGQLAGLETGHLPPEYRRVEDLVAYCIDVLAPTGLMALRIFGVRDPQAEVYGARFATAVQFNDVLCDIPEDYHEGRCFLPTELLTQYEIDLEQVRLHGPQPGWRALMRQLIDVNRQLYISAEPGIALLPLGAALMTAVIGALYQAQLADIEASDYDVFRQPPKFRLRHLLSAGRCVIRVLRARCTQGRPERVWSSGSGPSQGEVLAAVERM